MTEKDYQKLISLLFISDNFLKEITNFLAFNYPITTQECMLSVNCEKISSKVSKSSSSTPNSQSNECFLSVECEKSPSIVYNNFKISSSTPNSKSNARNEAKKLREEGKKDNEQKSEFVRVDGILKLKKNLKK